MRLPPLIEDLAPIRRLRAGLESRAAGAPLAIVAALGIATAIWVATDETSYETAFSTLVRADGRVEADAQEAGNPLSQPLGRAAPDADTLNDQHLVAAAASPIALVPAARDAACPALLARTFNRLQTGKPESLCQFEGKVLLVVNTASYCGYTHQYEGLEAMYRKYRDRGLVVVGFPSNDFEQEPGSNQEIAQFCRLTYGVEFPMYEKGSVTDLGSNPLIADLAARTGAAPKWNFHKYVIDRNGQPVASFASRVEPTDPRLVELVERLLAEPARAL
jgi:glutathione peroxidase